MDAPARSRAAPDPKVRQVGFFTPPPPPQADEPPSSDGALLSTNSFSPVTIIPAALSTKPVAVPAARRGLTGVHHPPPPPPPLIAGRYNPYDSLLGSTESSKTGDGNADEFSDGSTTFGWFQRSDFSMFAASASLPAYSGAGAGDLIAERRNGAVSNLQNQIRPEELKRTPNKSGDVNGFKKAAEEDHEGGAVNGAMNEQLPSAGPLKEKERPVKGEKPALGESSKAAKASGKVGGTTLAPATKQSKDKTAKAERRALQEAQRAAKAALKGDGHISVSVPVGESAMAKKTKQSSVKKDVTSRLSSIPVSDKKLGDRLPEKERRKDVPPPRMQFDDKSRVEKAKRKVVVKQTEARNRVELFRHLPQYEHGSQLPDLELRFFQIEPMHPAVYKVGMQNLARSLSGGNARCVAMLQAFWEVIRDHSTPPKKTLTRDLTAKIGSYVSFLSECRPLSISMGNAVRCLKNQIANLPMNLSEQDAKDSLCLAIKQFIDQKILLADRVIVGHAITKIKDGDVLLTYGSSCVVELIMLRAHELGKQFRVVIVDSRPSSEGLLLLRRLVTKGLNCTYTHINALSYIMHEVTLVFLGAASVLANGTLYSRIGTACVAMVAHAFLVPVLVCCESYKFHERVQLDSICFNELGDPDVISKVHGRKEVTYLRNWAGEENLRLLNLIYDVTPSEYITSVITDYGMVPSTSIPVILREYRRDGLWI